MNDPTNWNLDVDTGSFAFASPEEAKRAEAILNRCMRESFKNGRKVGLEEAAKICETAPDLLQNSTFDGAAAAIRALKDSLAGDER